MRVAAAFSGQTGQKFYVCEKRGRCAALRSEPVLCVCVWVLLFHLESWKIARAEIRAVERAQGTKREKERASCCNFCPCPLSA